MSEKKRHAFVECDYGFPEECMFRKDACHECGVMRVKHPPAAPLPVVGEEAREIGGRTRARWDVCDVKDYTERDPYDPEDYEAVDLTPLISAAFASTQAAAELERGRLQGSLYMLPALESLRAENEKLKGEAAESWAAIRCSAERDSDPCADGDDPCWVHVDRMQREEIASLKSAAAEAKTRLEAWKGGWVCECTLPGDDYADCHVHGGGDRDLFAEMPTVPTKVRIRLHSAEADVERLKGERDSLEEIRRLSQEAMERASARFGEDARTIASLKSAAAGLPKCQCDENPATCFGAYEGGFDLIGYGCDTCCGHGNEDGWCVSLADVPGKVGPMLAQGVADLDAAESSAAETIERAAKAVEALRPGFTIEIDTGRLVEDVDGPWGLPRRFSAAIRALLPAQAEGGGEKAPWPGYRAEHGDERLCECFHEYRRHFDTYERMAPVGCKYCGCGAYVPLPHQTAESPVEAPKILPLGHAYETGELSGLNCRHCGQTFVAHCEAEK